MKSSIRVRITTTITYLKLEGTPAWASLRDDEQTTRRWYRSTVAYGVDLNISDNNSVNKTNLGFFLCKSLYVYVFLNPSLLT